MVARCIVAFKDVDCGMMREVGDEFEVTADRFEAINGTRYGQLVAEVKKTRTRSKAKEQTEE